MALKSVIIYFSQTGNTEKTARAIARGIRSTDNHCDLISLREIDPGRSSTPKAPGSLTARVSGGIKLEGLEDYDLIGIGTPVFYFQEPWNIRDFIGKLSFLKGKAGFVFCTHGGQDANTLPRMAKNLREQGWLVLGGLSTRGYDSFQPYIEFGYSKGRPDEGDLAAAAAFGRRLVADYRLMKKENRLDILPEVRFKFSLLHLASLWLTKGRVNKYLPKIKVDRKKCIKCNKCAEICPSGAIDLNPYPVRIKECIKCYYCEKICPQGAIIVNWHPTKRLLGTFRLCARPVRALKGEIGKKCTEK
jgi:ferredoxin/flavodoxin